jgi:hypothetical protein
MMGVGPIAAGTEKATGKICVAKTGKNGVCKLTGATGKFVKAHLLPRAVTKPAVPGAPFVENGAHGGRPKRAWSSWYDRELVTAEGEAILAEFDNWAIPELRKHKLIWSGFGPLLALPFGQDHDAIPGTDCGIRKLMDTDFRKLRLFFLSLLWRAAASTHNGFAEISLAPDELAELGSRLIARDPASPSYFAVHLIQLSTLGEPHNLVPLARTKRIPAYKSVQEHEIPFFRIYFEGLIAHIHPNNDSKYDGEKVGALVLGQKEFTTVPTVKFEGSFQRENIANLVSGAWSKWPELMSKL